MENSNAGVLCGGDESMGPIVLLATGSYYYCCYRTGS